MADGRVAEARKAAEDLKAQIETLRRELKGGDQPLLDAIGGTSTRPLNPQCKVRRQLKGHFGKVYALHWSDKTLEDSGTHVLSASQDGKLIVWNGQTTNKIQAIPLRSSWVMTCAYEPTKGKMVACGGLDNMCSIYALGDPSMTRATKELAAHDGYLSCCRFISETQILTSSGDSTCILWDVDRAENLITFNDHGGDVMSVAIHPSDNDVFVSGSCDATAKVWDIRTESAVQTFPGHESDINSVAFFPNGNAFVTGSDDSTCRLFEMRCYSELAEYGDDKILCGITSVGISNSGRLLFGGYDDNCYGWDTLLHEKTYDIREHDNRVSCVGLNNKGEALCTGSWDTYLKIHA
jgi:guanine nucleotide-binding protein G(I)/G(S)/G(T) subunit beta-1